MIRWFLSQVRRAEATLSPQGGGSDEVHPGRRDPQGTGGEGRVQTGQRRKAARESMWTSNRQAAEQAVRIGEVEERPFNPNDSCLRYWRKYGRRVSPSCGITRDAVRVVSGFDWQVLPGRLVHSLTEESRHGKPSGAISIEGWCERGNHAGKKQGPSVLREQD
jgi:hypothetical protein